MQVSLESTCSGQDNTNTPDGGCVSDKRAIEAKDEWQMKNGGEGGGGRRE